MEKIRKYFGEYDITWPRVILFAVITGAYTAFIKLIPFLDNTSFQDIAVNLDCWFLFAIFIIVNCKKWWEASLKCFVFFLISQPLIYLIQVPFYEYGWTIFRYYKYWFIVTLLTLPGAAIAFLLKKKNWLSTAVLSVATGYLAYAAAFYLRSAVTDFPYHLLSAVFCLALSVFLIIVLLDEQKHRVAAFAVFAAIFIVFAAINLSNIDRSADITLDSGSWTYTLQDESVAEVEFSDDNHVTVTAKHSGGTYLTFKNADGAESEYYITVSGGNIWIDCLDE